jgi:hypothetical protein
VRRLRDGSSPSTGEAMTECYCESYYRYTCQSCREMVSNPPLVPACPTCSGPANACDCEDPPIAPAGITSDPRDPQTARGDSEKCSIRCIHYRGAVWLNGNHCDLFGEPITDRKRLPQCLEAEVSEP